MVRNNIAAANGVPPNTMLLMMHPSQENYIGSVKREVESPKEAEQKKEETVTKVAELPTPEVEEKEENKTGRLQDVTQLKTEEEKVEPEEVVAEKVVDNEPCIKTVAENVKVKNMKRKMKLEPEVQCSPPKKPKTEKPKGSYKDLINKNANCMKINNGRRKLNEPARRLVKLKKATTRQKLAVMRQETLARKSRTRPLTASNLHNSKLNMKESKKLASEAELTENKEPTTAKKKKKLAPTMLDNLFAKNSVDRTIDSVVSEATAKCKGCKVEKNNNNKKSTNVKCEKKTAECKGIIGAAKRKGRKSVEAVPQAVPKVPRRSLHCPRWSNGWTWEGEPFEATVFINVSRFLSFVVWNVRFIIRSPLTGPTSILEWKGTPLPVRVVVFFQHK